jgi:bacterial/archaeal transporter family-2 protein
MPYSLACLLTIVAGASVALQQVLNANLRAQIGSPWWAGFSSYFVGMVVMAFAALTLPGSKVNLAAVGDSPWWSWMGGLFGATFIGIGVVMVPRLGAATVMAFVVVGQMLAAMALDHFGLFGVPQHSANPLRLAGAGLLIAGVTLARI